MFSLEFTFHPVAPVDLDFGNSNLDCHEKSFDNTLNPDIEGRGVSWRHWLPTIIQQAYTILDNCWVLSNCLLSSLLAVGLLFCRVQPYHQPLQ